MLQTPFIIKEKFCNIDKLYENQNECYVKVYLNINHFDSNFLPTIINNQICKAILNKYPEKIDFFKSIKIENLKDFDWEKPMFYSDFLIDIQNEFKNIDIFFMEYETYSLDVRKYVNNLIRCNSVCTFGKLLFHIISDLRYNDFVKQGYRFETHCDNQILMHGHEIQTLRIFNNILIDDYNFN